MTIFQSVLEGYYGGRGVIIFSQELNGWSPIYPYWLKSLNKFVNGYKDIDFQT